MLDTYDDAIGGRTLQASNCEEDDGFAVVAEERSREKEGNFGECGGNCESDDRQEDQSLSKVLLFWFNFFFFGFNVEN